MLESYSNNRRIKNLKEANKRKRRKITFFFVLSIITVVVSLTTSFYFAIKMFVELGESKESEDECSFLQKIGNENDSETQHVKKRENENLNKNHESLLKENKDYIGWMFVNGINVDLPIVKCNNNEKYLNTSFRGRANKMGAIFMDCDCSSNFDFPITTIYGHTNVNYGGMFTSLHNLKQNDETFITIETKSKELFTFKVFSIKKTTVKDEIYSLNIKDEKDAIKVLGENVTSYKKVLVLSTCGTGSDLNERFLVLATLVDKK
ncbi:MAG: class B sortase [Oscillospiraceae bacterium]|jgi:sortase B|nr:class B sortase [Oscillospiraceae bacterium]